MSNSKKREKYFASGFIGVFLCTVLFSTFLSFSTEVLSQKEPMRFITVASGDAIVVSDLGKPVRMLVSEEQYFLFRNEAGKEFPGLETEAKNFFLEISLEPGDSIRLETGHKVKPLVLSEEGYATELQVELGWERWLKLWGWACLFGFLGGLLFLKALNGIERNADYLASNLSNR